MTQPALIGGLVMGVLSALPIISAGNFCCCLWVVSGGLVAAYVLQQSQVAPLTPADGALVGLLAGLIGAVVQFVLAVPIGILVAPLERAMLERLIELADTMPSDVRDSLETYLAQSEDMGLAALVLRRVATLFVMLLVGATFSTAGGMLGAVIFRKPPVPAAVDTSPAS